MALYRKSKSIKYKTFRKGRLKKLEFKATSLKFGTCGLKALESGIIKSNQLLAAKHSIIKKIKKKIKIWVAIFPDLAITTKPTGIRMGKGKGPISHWVSRVNCGKVLLEVCGPNNLALSNALKVGGSKLPIKTAVFS